MPNKLRHETDKQEKHVALGWKKDHREKVLVLVALQIRKTVRSFTPGPVFS